jgi:hypothetical protein
MVGSSAAQASWNMVGVGLRLAQDVGVHRKKVYNSRPSADEELFKRCFWCALVSVGLFDTDWSRTLIFIDRWNSCSAGRPCAIQEEECVSRFFVARKSGLSSNSFDVEMPVDCDDEYWTHPDPEQAFQQPQGKPSRLTAFISNLKLCQILGYSLRTIVRHRAYLRL